MRLGVSDRALIGIFMALAAGSVGLKAAFGAPHYMSFNRGFPQVQAHVVAILSAQGFVTSVQPLKIQTPIIHATRGDCRLIVRDARSGAATASVFASDARAIGPVRYLYDGASYNSPPNVRIHLDFFTANLLDRTGKTPPVHIPIAVARSQACPPGNFGLEDILITS